IDEVHAHGALGVVHVACHFLAGVMDAPYGRQIEVTHRDLVVLVFLHRVAQGIDLSLVRFLRGRGSAGTAKDEPQYWDEVKVSIFCKSHRVPPATGWDILDAQTGALLGAELPQCPLCTSGHGCGGPERHTRRPGLACGLYRTDAA